MSKSQLVRLIDVVVLGPFMMWAGRELRPRWAGDLMQVAGLLTIAYNARNLVGTARERNGP